MSNTPTVMETLRDPSVRYVAKEFLHRLLSMDPVDAWQDADLVARVLKRRMDKILAGQYLEHEEREA